MLKQDPLIKANLGVWDGYHVPMHTCEVRRFIQLLSSEEPGLLLDVGCADGQLGEHLNCLGWKSFGIDVSPANAYAATSRGVTSSISNLGSPLPFASNRFDAVVAKEVIEHLVDTRLLVAECWRVLRPGGCLILGTPNLASLSNRFRLLFGLYPGWMDYQVEGGIGHVRYYTLQTLCLQLTSAAFRVEKAVGTSLALPLLARFLDSDRAGWLAWLGYKLPSLSAVFVVKARKVT